MEPLQKVCCVSCRTVQAGFTLLEMLVVVALLAVIAGLGVAAYEMNGDDATAISLAQSEMTELAKALRQFRRDVGGYPIVLHEADFSLLAQNSVDSDNDLIDDNSGLPIFNKDTGRGIRGPYIEQRGLACVQVATYSPFVSNTVDAANNPIFVYAKYDPFRHQVAQLNPRIVWRENNGNACNALGNVLTGRQGNPYLLIDMPTGVLPNPANPRIVSTGPDGEYGGPNTTDVCQPNRAVDAGKDDLVLCL